MALLSGLGTVMWPVAKYVGGLLYVIGGYYAVYGTAMSCTFLGVGYIYFVPETIVKRDKIKNSDEKHLIGEDVSPQTFREKLLDLYVKSNHVFYVGNRTIYDAYR